MAEESWGLLLSCEHGGAKVPRPYLAAFSPEEKALLATHRGWDAGALAVAKQLAQSFGCALVFTEISRLLVDLNRSAHHRTCLGPPFRDADPEIKAAIFETYYWPYRLAFEERLEKMLEKHGKVLHLAIHSFTPVLNGETRNADLGLLYDPGRPSEKRWADRLHDALDPLPPALRIRRNYPYLGKADGLTAALRKKFAARRYAGLEIELNQSAVAKRRDRDAIAKKLGAAIAAARAMF